MNDAKMKKSTPSTFLPWIDVSVPLYPGMVHWPTDPPFERVLVEELDKGDHVNLSKLIMGSHSGTHVDAPLHFISKGMDISAMPLETLVGPARVIEILDRKSISVQELMQHKIRRNQRLLFKTHNSSNLWQSDDFAEDFVSLSQEAADYLVRQKIKMIGIDYLSVGAFHGDGGNVHRKLLNSNIGIIEGLNLSLVNAGKYYLVCLPLKIKSGEGAPARVILRPIP